MSGYNSSSRQRDKRQTPERYTLKLSRGPYARVVFCMQRIAKTLRLGFLAHNDAAHFLEGLYQRVVADFAKPLSLKRTIHIVN